MSQVDSPCMKILDPVFAPTLQHMLLKVNKHHIYDLFFFFFFGHNFIKVGYVNSLFCFGSVDLNVNFLSFTHTNSHSFGALN